MSSNMYIFGGYIPVEISCADDEPSITISTRGDRVLLELTREQRAELRKAIDAADELDAPLPGITEVTP